jgi:SAM-dependent methyltransferase
MVSALALIANVTVAQSVGDELYQPNEFQPGKDVVWVPTPAPVVEKMLDAASVTARDFVIDLGSGDGRNVIAAAKRGAHALGVEFNNDMVELSRRIAEREGVSEKAKFVQGDMFEADISQATVFALFLLTENLNKLAPKFLGLKPGTRIVSNTFTITDWTPERTQRLEDGCGAWCDILLYLVPANVAGRWRTPQGELVLDQKAQTVEGTLAKNGKVIKIEEGKMSGARFTFAADGVRYACEIEGNAMRGAASGAGGGTCSAQRVAR